VPAPYELLAVPFHAYLALPGTPEPDLTEAIDASGSDWVLLGTLGADEYDEDGITVTHEQNIEYFRGLGKTIPIKAFRTSEGLTLGLVVRDVTMETYAKALNDATVDSSDPGSKALALYQGYNVAQYALAIRSADGPYADGAAMQYWVPTVVQSGNPAPVYKRGTPAGLAFTFTTMKGVDATDPSEYLGVVRALTEAPGS
jgi:hypothetical protein